MLPAHKETLKLAPRCSTLLLYYFSGSKIIYFWIWSCFTNKSLLPLGQKNICAGTCNFGCWRAVVTSASTKGPGRLGLHRQEPPEIRFICVVGWHMGPAAQMSICAGGWCYPPMQMLFNLYEWNGQKNELSKTLFTYHNTSINIY